MEYTYVTTSPFVAGKPMQIQVRNKFGAYLGAYRGYYNYRRKCVKCYPAHNPSGISLPVCEISERLIHRRAP